MIHTAVVVVDTSLGQHGVILELRLAEGRAVAGNDDQLGCMKRWSISHSSFSKAHVQQFLISLTLALTESLQGGLVAQGVLARLGDKLETGVDGLGTLGGLLGLLVNGSHCLLSISSAKY